MRVVLAVAELFPWHANDSGRRTPGAGKNWIATIPDKGFFTILRLYGPTKAFFDKSWKPGDLEKIK